MSTVIKQLDASAAPAWDAFVNSCEEATFFHRAGWKSVIEQAFGHRCYYLYAVDPQAPEQLLGVLPLVEVKSLLFGHSLVSTPFCVYGGVVADDPNVGQQLIAEAQRLAEELQVDYLELRHREAKTDGWLCKSAHATFRKPLDADDEANMLAMKRKQRAVIRQAIQNEHQTELDASLDTFYDLYSNSVRNLGTPVFAKKFFRLLQSEFGDDCEVLTIHHEGKPTSTLMSFFHRNEVLPYYAGSLMESRQLKSMDFMYWDQMCRANSSRRNGDNELIYDFGRSKVDSGPYNYKRHWGFEPQPLCYEYYLVKATELPDLNPHNPKYKFFINAWKKLPLKVSQWLGPHLSKYLG